MLCYRPPKGNCWGHSLGASISELDGFIDAYFDRVPPEPARPDSSESFVWKESVLPHAEWQSAFLGPDSARNQQMLFSLFLDQLSFLTGIIFPLCTSNPESFSFIERFATDAPFRMNPKHFSVGHILNNGGFRWRKAGGEVAASLKDCIDRAMVIRSERRRTKRRGPSAK
jgi:hypothetical protein